MKTCNNKCGMNWCCSGESFMSHKDRWDKEGIEFSKNKGIYVFEGKENAVRVYVGCKCCKLQNGKCFIHENKPKGCREFPTEQHYGMILTEKCKYFDANKHISFEQLKPYQPEV